MEYRTAILCDYVRPEGGIAHLIAANINTIYAPEIPFGQNLGLLVLMKLARDETELPHDLRIRIRPNLGEVMFEASGQVMATGWDETLPEGWLLDASIGLNFGVPFQAYGEYLVDVTVDNVLQEVLNFRVLPPR